MGILVLAFMSASGWLIGVLFIEAAGVLEFEAGLAISLSSIRLVG
jgi:hypothetical protein